MKSFKFLPRFIAIFGLLMICSLSVWGTVVDTDTFDVDTDGWGGTGETWDSINARLAINRNQTGTKTYTFAALSNQMVTVTLTVTKTTNWEAADIIRITANGTQVHNSNSDGTITFNATLNASGELALVVTPVTSNDNEDLYVDNVSIDDTPTFSYTSDNERPFTMQYSVNQFGDLASIGNTVLCKSTVQTASYKTGTCQAPAAADSNDAIYTLYHKLSADANTSSIYNSSSSQLSLPTGAQVLWATLYWQGGINSNTIDTTTGDANLTNMTNAMNKAKTVLFKTPDTNGSYVTITSNSGKFNWNNNSASYNYYQGAKEVTQYVTQSGTYQIANLVTNDGASDGGTGPYGGWSLVVVYRDDNATLKNLTVYDGYKLVQSDFSTTFTGFLTPRSGTVESKFTLFAAEADSTRTDALYLTNPSGVSTLVASNELDSSVKDSSGSSVTTRTPSYSNTIGTDIHTWNVGTSSGGKNIISNNQTATTVTFDYGTDIYNLGNFAFATQLYTPNFCYDYGYEQNGRPFTEANNGTQMPYVSGYLPNLSDINVSIYIRNQENSDVFANNIQMDITDINATQAIYKRNSVGVTYGNTFVITPIPDSSLIVSDISIREIPVGSLGGTEYAYAYYALTPQSIGDISMPIKGTFAYDLVIPLPDGTTLTYPYSSIIGGSRLPMCSVANFSYTPQWGIFSMVDAGLYNSSSANRYYDLATQVTRRPGNFRIASFEPAALDTPKAVSSIVAVEMIDAGQFHDVDAACREPNSAITPRIWVGFDGNVTQVNFNAATINQAISDGAVSDSITEGASSLASAEDFYKTATPNAAYRITFNVTNDGNALIQTAPGTPSTNTQILNFPQLVQDIGTCRRPVEHPSNPSQTTQNVAVACGNAGNQGIDKHHMAICMECLYGYNTQVLCSRDNFAIRPESYTVALKDVDQSNHAITQLFAPGHTGVVVPDISQVNMDTGYVYKYDINATNHVDNTMSSGYTRYFGTDDNDYNISLVWNPSTVKTGCNDTNSSSQAFNMINGTVSDEGLHNQVGEYKLNIIDKTWTAVDWDPALQGHQTGTHFLSGVECLQNSTYVPAQATVVGLSGTSLTNLVGCTINSTHDNIENSLKYRDYNLAFKPDHFDLTGIGFATGQEFNVSAINQNVWTYMNNIHLDETMGVRYSGQIRALGENNSTLSNFVTNCYAEPINLDLNLTFPTTAGLPDWRYRLQEINASVPPAIWRDSNAVVPLPITNTSFNLVNIAESGFLKNQNGLLDMNLSINFDRNQTLPVNPITVGLDNLQVKCQTSANCSSNADMIANHLPDTNLTTNSNITFAYGRLLTKDIRIFGQNAFIPNGWYEFFNLPTFNGTAYQPSKNGASWFINAGHDDISHGDATVTRLMSSSLPNGTVNYGGDNALGIEVFGFPAIAPIYNGKAHVDTAQWLWYAPNALPYSDPSTTNPANFAGNDAACLTHPCFNVTVMPAIGATGSAKSTNEANKDSKRSTGGGAWRSTTDYAPAIR